jgi:hypothetical protein
MPESIGHHIGGERDIGQGNRTQPVFNPATGEQSGRLSLATEADVDRAAAAARHVRCVVQYDAPEARAYPEQVSSHFGGENGAARDRHQCGAR